MKRMKLSQELIAILAVGVTLTGLQVTLFVSLRGEMSEWRGDMETMEARLRGEMNILREDVRHDLDAIRIDIRDIREDVRQLRDKLLVPATGG